MLMTKKRKLKISKLLAATIFIVENEKNITPESFDKIVSNLFDISYEVGGFPIMGCTMRYVKELRKGAKEC